MQPFSPSLFTSASSAGRISGVMGASAGLGLSDVILDLFAGLAQATGTFKLQGLVLNAPFGSQAGRSTTELEYWGACIYVVWRSRSALQVALGLNTVILLSFRQWYSGRKFMGAHGFCF